MPQDSDLPTNLLRIAKSSAARYDQTVETAVPPGISQRAFQARAIGERGSCTLGYRQMVTPNIYSD